MSDTQESNKVEITEAETKAVETVEKVDAAETAQQSQPAEADKDASSEKDAQTPEKDAGASSSADASSDKTPANAAHGGRETSDKVLYVGNLDKAITEDTLKQYFQVAGPIAEVKVMVDKKNSHVNYAFVEYTTHHAASVAMQTLNGIQVENRKVKINWAFQSQQASNDDSAFNLFVGDLSVDVDDETLRAAFNTFPSFIQGHVMWDMQTGRSRGYGFASFATQEDAQAAMDALQGTEINGRAIRINWATKKDNSASSNSSHNNGHPRNNRGPRNNNRGPRNNNNNQQMNAPPPQQMNAPPPQQMGGMPPQQMNAPPPQLAPPPVNPQAIDDMIRRAPQRVTTAYIGNIPHFATEADLIPLLQNFGFILDFSYYPEKGCCFIKYDTHEQAAVCIVALANFQFQGRNLRTGWGKERNTYMQQPPAPQQGMMPPPPQMMQGNPMANAGPMDQQQAPEQPQEQPQEQ